MFLVQVSKGPLLDTAKKLRVMPVEHRNSEDESNEEQKKKLRVRRRALPRRVESRRLRR
jgi:hypothetical protein